MPNYNVYRKDGSWVVKKAGADRVSGSFDRQQQAERAAKDFAANAGGGEVRIHGRDGRIRDSDTVAPGNDPCPPRDKRH